MNRLSGNISNIEVSGNLSLVSVALNGDITLKTIVIETPDTASYLSKGNKIDVLFKETEVILGSDQKHAISIQNQLQGTVLMIDKAELLTKVVVRTEVGEITSILSTEDAVQLGLENQMSVIAMIKLNEIMLSE